MWLWEGPLGRPFGKALWEGSLRRPFGKALWERAEPFWQFDEIDMSECRFVRYVDLCGMIGKYILNVSTGADSEYPSRRLAGRIELHTSSRCSSSARHTLGGVHRLRLRLRQLDLLARSHCPSRWRERVLEEERHSWNHRRRFSALHGKYGEIRIVSTVSGLYQASVQIQ
jgi:hypothetical protein